MKRILDKIWVYLTIRKFLHIKLSFYKEWFGKGIIRVHTSLKDWYLFLVQWIHHNVQFKIQYSQVVSAIPRRQVGKAKQNLGPKFSYSPDDTSFQVSSTKKVNSGIEV